MTMREKLDSISLGTPARVFLWGVALAMIAYVLWLWFFPIGQYFLDDEWFVLPERIWHRGRGEWLAHLLFFNQTRETFVGDYMLYRPGLFFWMWIQDVLFRAHRTAEQFVLIGVTVALFFSFAKMIYRAAGAWMTTIAVLFAFTCVPGYFVFAWPHLGGYLLAIGLYTWAARRWIEPQTTRPGLLLTTLLFFVAETCHEFVAVTLVVLAAGEILFLRRKDRASSNRRLAVLAGAVASYGLLVVVAMLSLRPPQFFSPGEAQAVHVDFGFVLALVQRLGLIGWRVLINLVPFSASSDWASENYLLVGVLLIVGLTATSLWRERKAIDFRRLLVCAAPVLALVVGLSVGRVALRGNIKVHYFPIFQYFLVLGLCLILGPLVRRRPWISGAVLLVFLASALESARLVRDINEQRPEYVEALLRAVDQIGDEMSAHPERCFAGAYDVENRFLVNSGLTLALSESLCGWHAGTPTYYRVGRNGEVLAMDRPETFGAFRAVEGRDLELEQRSGEIATYLVGQPYNRLAATQGIGHEGMISRRATLTEVRADEVRLEFESEDGDVEFFGLGLSLVGSSSAKYFLLSDNMLKILERTSDGRLIELANASLAWTPKKAALRLLRKDDACLVMLDDQLIAETQSCLGEPIKIGFLIFANGSPDERITSLQYR